MKADSRLVSDPFDLVRAFDPVRRSALASEGIEGALDEIGAAIVSQPARPARRRSMGARRRVLVVAATMLAIGAGVAAGAVVFGAHTGLFPTKAEQAIGGPWRGAESCCIRFPLGGAAGRLRHPLPEGVRLLARVGPEDTGPDLEATEPVPAGRRRRSLPDWFRPVRSTAGSPRAPSAPGCRAGARRALPAMRTQLRRPRR